MASTNPTPEPKIADEQNPRATTLDVSRTSMRRRKRRVKMIVLVFALALVACAFLLYRHYSQFESTDDAEIDGYIYPVSARVAGYVTRVTVDDGQYVKAGTPLAQLDRTDYEVAVANAKAALANDRSTAASLQTNVPITSVNT